MPLDKIDFYGAVMDGRKHPVAQAEVTIIGCKKRKFSIATDKEGLFHVQEECSDYVHIYEVTIGDNKRCMVASNDQKYNSEVAVFTDYPKSTDKSWRNHGEESPYLIECRWEK